MQMEEAHASPTHDSTYFPACMASPAWFASRRRSNPTRFHLLASDAANGVLRSARRRTWRRILDRLVKEGKKSVCRSSAAASKPLITFGYDAASYAKNFDDGCRADGSRRFRPEDVAGCRRAEAC